MMTPKEDIFACLNAVPEGYGALRKAVFEGRIDHLFPNVTLWNHVGCIRAHIAEVRGVKSWDLPGAAKYDIRSVNYDVRPIEKFIEAADIRTGMRPKDCEALRQIVSWLDEWNEARKSSEGEDF